MSKMPSGGRWLAAVLAVATLGGCASVDRDAAFAPLARAAEERSGQPPRWIRDAEQRAAADARVATLLTAPLTAEAAVEIALINNRGLQAAFEQLGIAEAERAQALRLPNPGVRFGRLQRGDEREIERSVHVDLARLLAAPLVRQLESDRLEQVRHDTLLQLMTLVTETRKAQVQAVAAEESLRYMRQVLDAADASAELARRMAAVGNFSQLQRLREQGFHAEAALGVARAEQTRIATREKLTRQLGLWGAQIGYALPDRLPDLPGAADELPDVERTAIGRRLDVQSARLAAEQAASRLDLGRATRFINVLELGYQRNGSNQAPRQTGWEIGFELPLFDTGDARLARAEGIYRQAAHQAAEVAINARSEVREAYAGYRHAWDIARHHRDELVPLRRRIAEENLLRYNGMLIGVFELLADARAQIAGVNAYLEALRDFWLARTDLDMALDGPTRAAPASGPGLATAAGPVAH